MMIFDSLMMSYLKMEIGEITVGYIISEKL